MTKDDINNFKEGFICFHALLQDHMQQYYAEMYAQTERGKFQDRTLNQLCVVEIWELCTSAPLRLSVTS